MHLDILKILDEMWLDYAKQYNVMRRQAAKPTYIISAFGFTNDSPYREIVAGWKND